MATTAPGPASDLDRGGLAAAVGAYTVWGLFPAFWGLLAASGPVEVLAHRVAGTAVLMVAVLTVVGGWSTLRRLDARGWAMVAAAAALISANWGVYIYAVLAGQVVEAALGYFVSPLVSVLLGVGVLRERLNRTRWAAVAVAAVAVVVIAVQSGRPPWIALVLAGSFGLYGLIKARIPLTATASVTAEGLVLAPVAIGGVVWLEATGAGTFTALGPAHTLLLLAAGPVTAIPLLLYGTAALRVPLSTIGVLMYLNPTLQFLWGVTVVGEDMPAARWLGFALVWTALALFTADLLRRARGPQPDARSSSSSNTVGSSRSTTG